MGLEFDAPYLVQLCRDSRNKSVSDLELEPNWRRLYEGQLALGRELIRRYTDGQSGAIVLVNRIDGPIEVTDHVPDDIGEIDGFCDLSAQETFLAECVALVLTIESLGEIAQQLQELCK